MMKLVGKMRSAKVARAEATRRRILASAIHEFSAHGMAGARTEAIAHAAGVNKALLFYYFKNKQGVYAAAFEQVANQVALRAKTVLDAEASAGERLLRTALEHFDRILTNPEVQTLMEQEMVRFRRGESALLTMMAERAQRPLLRRLREVIEEGVRSGELCDLDWLQVLCAAVGPHVFYFLTAPMMRLAVPFEPFEKAALRRRRNAAIQFLGQALFVDRKHGAAVAKRVLASLPMPRSTRFSVGRTKR
jgi:TetR/AcrR family transcriptional regulator